MNDRLLARNSPRDGPPGCRWWHRGFTLTELISTGAVMTLLLAITAPVVTRNREGERTAACLTNLKRLGQAISMYVADNQGSLPGPTSDHVWWNAGNGFLPALESWYRVQLTYYLAPYAERGGLDDRPADLLPFCPSAAGIAAGGHLPMPTSYGRAKLYYLANTFGWDVSYERAGDYPYYRTQYGSYFGRVNSTAEDPASLPPDRLPKRLDAIPNVATEWAIADLWYWQAAPPRRSPRPVGTWPYPVTNTSSSTISSNGQLLVPSYPFHGTTKTFSPIIGTDNSLNSPRLTTGRTNAVYFDGHAASVRNWQGTVNPCFAESPGVCN